MAYLTGGDPNPEAFLSNAAAVIEGGADILEVGIPFSDPIADGPVIQASSQRALAAGTTPRRVLDQIRELSNSYEVPLVALTYYNPVLAMGLERFMRNAHESGINGVVVPDLPVEESEDYRRAALRNDIDTIFLSAPNTSPSRLGKILEKSRGFLYLVSLYGVTGPREILSPHALAAVRKSKALAKGKIPVAAGFGISRPDHVTTLIRSGADGAIVGSALVRVISEHLGQPEETTNLLRATAEDLKDATRQTRLE